MLTPRTLVWHGIAFNHEQVDIAERDVAGSDAVRNSVTILISLEGMRIGLGIIFSVPCTVAGY